jgi:tetratricopeptide (TPR) repeat protein
VRTLEPISSNAEPLTILKAKLLAVGGNADQALKLLDTVAASSTDARTLRAHITAGTATPADLEKQLAGDPKNAVILGRLCTLLRRDDPPKAIGYCRQASEVEPGNLKHAIGFAAALIQAKQYDQAVHILRKLLDLAPDNWTVHANLATALFELKRFKEAKPEYVWLTSKQPKLPAAYLFLAITCDQLGEYLDAMANYQQFLRLADVNESKLDIEKVNLRLPQLQRQIKEGKGKK